MTADPSEARIEFVTAQASRWIVRLGAPDCSSGEIAQFERWLGEDPLHAQIFDSLQGMWGGISALGEKACAGDHPRAARMSAAYGPRLRRRNWSRQLAAAAAAVLLVLASASLWLEWPSPSNVYRTATGKQLTVTLADGSVAHLNTDTKLTVNYGAMSRNIMLAHGEALFNVAHDKARPFIVYSAGGAIRAVGTSFNVRNHHGEVSVTVLEGTIEVVKAKPAQAGNLRPVSTPERVTAGQMVNYAPAALGPVKKASPLEIRRTDAWQKGKLVFDGMRLDAIVEEINSYMPGRVVIMDDSLAELEGGGMFQVNDVQSAVSAIERALPVRVVRVTPYLTLLFASEDQT